MKRYLSLVLVLSLSGCVTLPPPPQGREEWNSVHTREFSEASVEEVSAAAEKVLRLADHDFTFDYPDGQLMATRHWLVYMLLAASMGTDYWKLTMEPIPSGTRATLQISRAASAVSPTPVVGLGGAVGTSVVSSAMPGRPIRYPSAYELFWSRVEFLLGRSSDWVTCDEFESGKSVADKAEIYVLCSINTDDNSPNKATTTQ